MQTRKRICVSAWLAAVALALAFAGSAPMATAQTAARFVGTITAITGTTLTVKTDADGERPVAGSGDSADQADCSGTEGFERGGGDPVQRSWLKGTACW